MSGERYEVSAGTSSFTIYRSGDQVEVYRTSMAVLPRRSEAFSDAENAIRDATGCDLAKGSLTGDVALMTAELSCG